MKVYLKDGNLYWLEEPLDGAEMSWDLSETQQEFLRGGGYAELRETQLIIVPKAPEVVETEDSSVLTKREFLSRITPEEYAAIKAATQTNSYVDYFWQMFTLSEFIDIKYIDTVNGVNMLEQFGVIGAGRASEILN